MVRKTWTHQIEVDLVYDSPFEVIRDTVVSAVRSSPAMTDGDRGVELSDLVDELAETDDADEFDMVMSAIWDPGDWDKWLWLYFRWRDYAVRGEG